MLRAPTDMLSLGGVRGESLAAIALAGLAP